MKKEHLLNPIFITSLLVLILNDFIFKAAFGNFFTGKLSDFSGIVVFAMFLLALFPAKKLSVFVFTALFFTCWKSPLSSPLIAWINQSSDLNYVRTIDYTDLVCLFVLIPLYFYEAKTNTSSPFQRFSFNALLLVAVFAMVSTSRFNMSDYGYVYVGKKMTLHKSKSDFLRTLDQHGIQYEITKKYLYKKDSVEAYELKKFLMDSDTIYLANISILQRAKKPEKQKIELFIRNIYITEKGKPIDMYNYSQADSVEKVYRENTITYFKKLYPEK